MFEYPTRIRVRSCAFDDKTEMLKPYNLTSLDAPYISTDPCECQETPMSTS